MQRDAGGSAPIAELRVDGGACANDLLMQFQADLLGVPVVRPEITETTALGAAYLAGLAVGVYRSLDELRAQWRVERRFQPTMPRERARSAWRRGSARCGRRPRHDGRRATRSPAVRRWIGDQRRMRNPLFGAGGRSAACESNRANVFSCVAGYRAYYRV